MNPPFLRHMSYTGTAWCPACRRTVMVRMAAGYDNAVEPPVLANYCSHCPRSRATRLRVWPMPGLVRVRDEEAV